MKFLKAVHLQFILVLLVGLILGILPSLFSEPQSYFGKKISKIEFYGLKNLVTDELYEVMESRLEKPLNEVSTNNDLRKFFSLGYFSNVIIRVKLLQDNTVKLIFQVEELPQIQEINYVGLIKLSTQDFIKKIDLVEKSFFSLQKVKNTTQAIKAALIEQGYTFAEVWYKTSQISKGNKISVSFIIDEGELLPISKINIIGTRRIDADQVLGILQQKESGIIADVGFQVSKFEEDKLVILSFAKSQGLLGAELDPEATGYEIRWKDPKNPEKGRVVVVTYKILEGDIKYFGGYSIEHDPNRINKELNPVEREKKEAKDITPIYSPESLLENLTLNYGNIGDYFDENKYFQDRGNIQEAYARQGYVFAQIQPQNIEFNLDEETLTKYEACQKKNDGSKCSEDAKHLDLVHLRKWLNENPSEKGRPLRHVHFKISENNLAYIENIIIKGNEKTLDYVIKRNIVLKEGQLFNSNLVQISRQRLLNTQFFKEVNLQMRPGSDQNKMIVVFEFKEQPTGNIQVGGTYSVLTGFALNIKLGDSNYNGTGQTLTGGVDYGPNRRSLNISWNEPWFYDRCDKIKGSFWKNKQKDIDKAHSLDEIISIAQSLESDNEVYKIRILKVINKNKSSHPSLALDSIKQKIRDLLAEKVLPEEDCFRSYPTPWALGISFFVDSFTQPVTSIEIGNQVTYTDAQIQTNRVGLGFSTSHPINHYWSNYHSYNPNFSSISQSTSLAPDVYFLREQIGLQFQSSLRNGLLYNSIDNNFNPTEGFRQRIELEIVGGLIAGSDHYNRAIVSSTYYFSWFDFSFGGKLPNKELKLWKVVQEFTFSATFTQETRPVYNTQDSTINPYYENYDKLYLGGPGSREYGRLRGYDYSDLNYPQDWRLGSHHMIIYGTEIRIPFEPRYLWFVTFFDAGSLFNQVRNFTGDQKARYENYNIRGNTECANANSPIPNKSCIEWNDPNRTVLSSQNLALDRFLYSWGFGLRIQIPVLPLRLYLAQKIYYAGGFQFRPLPNDSGFNLAFAIGDYNF